MKPNRELAVKILNKLIETNRLKKPGCEWDTTIGIVTFILDQNDARKLENYTEIENLVFHKFIFCKKLS
tara:strand:+ start:566 stop:772 length:207 start_codon:yes stop_codon:yes gene_type:complete